MVLSTKLGLGKKRCQIMKLVIFRPGLVFFLEFAVVLNQRY
jgi:hypothetical protein